MHPDLAGSLRFVIGSFFFLDTAMVFGLVVSASSWEPFRHAIMAMNQVYFVKNGLEVTHKKIMTMLQWDAPPPDGVRFTPATACPINQGVLGACGEPLPTPVFIYVDDCLIVISSCR